MEKALFISPTVPDSCTVGLLQQEHRAWAEVDLNAIEANAVTLRSLADASGGHVLAVVKADAYGHGLIPVATAAQAGAEWLGVATVSEGASLREAGITTPILLLCAPAPREARALLHYGLTATLGDASTLDSLAAAIRGLTLAQLPDVHIEIDTGIGRAGVLPEQAVKFWKAALSAGLRVTGLMTHFADADGDVEFTLRQRQLFQQVKHELERQGASFEWVHMSNSAGTLQFGAAEGNLFRSGLLLYGICPRTPTASILNEELENQSRFPVSDAGGMVGLSAAMTVKARVAAVRCLPSGHNISYGSTHRLLRPSRVATVLIGYGDGYPRRLSNIGSMLLNGCRAPILGRVCMDQTVVDVTDIPHVEADDVAVCLGTQGTESLRVEELAALIEGTEHELTTCFTARLPRVFVD